MKMESLESINKRIEYGRSVNNDASRMFFSLEPTLRYTLIHYLLRMSDVQITEAHFYNISDLELIKIFDEVVKPDASIYDQIIELYQAVIDFRLITFSRRHGVYNEAIQDKINNLKNTDYYLSVMEDVVTKLLSENPEMT